ncbi:FAD-binding oxidoreductase [Emcibacteraceae bacterium]|nr:FAD-binding oxidoreductase [Emcibacteraceae bacterium]
MLVKINSLPKNDQSCGWIENLAPKLTFPKINGDKIADWLVIGGGYTGLSFARRMAEKRPDLKIIVIDSEVIGEGASSRNSGFAIANSTTSATYKKEELAEINRLNRINKMGLKILKEIIEKHNIDCQWREVGKYHCGADPTSDIAAEKLKVWLNALEIDYEDLGKEELKNHLGTDFYRRGIWTKEDVLLQPAALVRGLSQSLPDNVELYDYSPALNISCPSNEVLVECPNGQVLAKNLVIATNSLLHEMTPKPSYTVPLTLTASLTRPLSNEEKISIGSPNDWGVLPLHDMGATVRYTVDHRILIRNTLEYRANENLNQNDMEVAIELHKKCFDQRFPTLQQVEFENSWQGKVAVSRNAKMYFGKLTHNIYASGCYNASGISRGTAYGYSLANYALGHYDTLLNDILQGEKPNWLPPRPLLDAVMKSVIWIRKRDLGLDK